MHIYVYIYICVCVCIYIPITLQAVVINISEVRLMGNYKLVVVKHEIRVSVLIYCCVK